MSSMEESKLPEKRESCKAVTIRTLAPEEKQEWLSAWEQFHRVYERELREATTEMNESDEARSVLLVAMLERLDALRPEDKIADKRDAKADALLWAWNELRRLGLVSATRVKPMSDARWLRGIGIKPWRRGRAA